MAIHPHQIVQQAFEALLVKTRTGRWIPHGPRPRSKTPIEKRMQILGHRGARGMAPENTMAGFEVCRTLGIGFELDVQLCTSGEPVVFHDDRLERCTNGSGKLADHSLKQLKKLDAGSHFGTKFKNESIPTLAEVLDAFGEELVIDIEIKDESFRQNVKPLVEAVYREIDKRNLHERVVISSFNPEILWLMRERCPQLLRGQLYYSFHDTALPIMQREFLRRLGFNAQTKPDWVVPRHVMVTGDYVAKYHQLGYRIATWTVNHPFEMLRLLELGVDSIITDFPATLVALVAEFTKSPAGSR